MKIYQQFFYNKLLLGIFVLCCTAVDVQAQATLGAENFTSVATGSISAVTTNTPWRYQGATHACAVPSADNHEWSVRSGTFNGNAASGFSGNFAVVQSDLGTDCQGDSYMLAARFTMPAGATTAKISYLHYYEDFSSTDAAYVYVYNRTTGAYINAGAAYKTYTSDQGSASSPVSDGFSLTGLTPGSTYEVVFRYVANNDYYWLVDNILVTGPPANDNCSAATAMTVNAVGSCTTTYTANTTDATNSNVTPTGSCSSNSGTPDDDIWYSFVAPASGAVNLKNTYVSGVTDIYYQVFSGACASSMTSILCSDSDNGGTITGLTSGTTYYIRLYTYGSAVATNYTLCLQALPAYTYGSSDCANPTKLCSDGSLLNFGTNATGNTPGSNNYGCLGSTPRPTWFYFKVENPGDMNLQINGYNTTPAAVDVDYALWGPYANLVAAQAACGTLPAPTSCNFSASSVENMAITGATTGSVYLLLVTGYSPQSASFTLQQTSGTASTECSSVAGACDISNVVISNSSICSNNSTVLATDDYYTADVTVTFANKPASGNLQLTGAGIHSSGTYATSVASIGTTTYTFTGVKIKADGNSQTIRADFSALTGCNFIKSGIAAVNSCSCAASLPTLNVTTP